MEQNYKYSVGASGSGWGVWNNEGIKVKGFGSTSKDRFEALKYMYMLYGWDFSKSKYVRQNPWLVNVKYSWEA